MWHLKEDVSVMGLCRYSLLSLFMTHNISHLFVTFPYPAIVLDNEVFIIGFCTKDIPKTYNYIQPGLPFYYS